MANALLGLGGRGHARRCAMVFDNLRSFVVACPSSATGRSLCRVRVIFQQRWSGFAVVSIQFASRGDWMMDQSLRIALRTSALGILIPLTMYVTGWFTQTCWQQSPRRQVIASPHQVERRTCEQDELSKSKPENNCPIVRVRSIEPGDCR